MYFFSLSIQDISFQGLEATLRRMNASSGLAGANVMFHDGVEFYSVYSSNVDADKFRQILQDDAVGYNEPGDLPLSIKNSPQYAEFLRRLGSM